MFKSLKAIWKDPVFSKVIAAGILSLGAWYFKIDLEPMWNLLMFYWYFPVIAILFITIICLCMKIYRLKESKEPDWYRYRTDIFSDVKWIWNWAGNNIINLTALCPSCDFELDECNIFKTLEGYTIRSAFPEGYQWKKCDFKKQIGDNFGEIENLVCKEIGRNIRIGKYKVNN